MSTNAWSTATVGLITPQAFLPGLETRPSSRRTSFHELTEKWRHSQIRWRWGPGFEAIFCPGLPLPHGYHEREHSSQTRFPRLPPSWQADLVLFPFPENMWPHLTTVLYWGLEVVSLPIHFNGNRLSSVDSQTGDPLPLLRSLPSSALLTHSVPSLPFPPPRQDILKLNTATKCFNYVNTEEEKLLVPPPPLAHLAVHPAVIQSKLAVLL